MLRPEHAERLRDALWALLGGGAKGAGIDLSEGAGGDVGGSDGGAVGGGDAGSLRSRLEALWRGWLECGRGGPSVIAER